MPGTQDDLAPSGAKARYHANIAALKLATTLTMQGRVATPDEQRVLAQWSSWGAVSDVFDERKENWANERTQLRGLLTAEEWRAAERTTINAHYTDPLIVRRMWSLLEQLGFSSGTVLEPGSGAGTFIGLAPDTANMVGVELDPVTARISQALYPEVQIRTESFADTRLPDNHFDASIGNVPFSDVALHDPRHNASQHSLHNHFIVKALALTRPGGLVAVISSAYTMDAQNPAARQDMNAMADLIGAVRLPTGAHRRAAGTDVVTDILVFRKREPGTPPASTVWEQATRSLVDGELVTINTYFQHQPEHILGTVSVEPGMYASPMLHVTADLTALDHTLEHALASIVESATHQGLLMSERTTEQQASRAAFVEAPADRWEGSIVFTAAGFHTVVAGGLEPLAVPKTAHAEMRLLLELRDTATALLKLESITLDDTAEISETRALLTQRYDSYRARYGPINRFTSRKTGRVQDNGDESVARMIPTPIRLLRADPFGPLVLALEVFDDHSQTAIPAEILRTRVVAPHPEIHSVDTPSDALAISLDRTGRIDLGLIASLLQLEESDVPSALTGLAFLDPETSEYVHAAEYLSGNVRAKYAAALARAQDDPTFQEHVEALRPIIPTDVGVEDIVPRLGAVWISEKIHQQFLRELLHAPTLKVESPLPGVWEIRGGRHGLLSTSEWGTERRPAPDIAAAVMEQRSLLVYDETTDSDGVSRKTLNAVHSTAAQEKAEALQERFAEWVWEEPARAAGLVREYNDRFNNIVLRDYTQAGDYLTLPGMAKNFIPRPHQRAAVARMVAEPAAGLFHEVGAGKTAEMVMGAMEMKRMGLIHKPVIVVPNHMLNQFTREWLQIYPHAHILAASSTDLTGDKRRVFIARAAANDWDGIILTQGAFAKIPVQRHTEDAYLQRHIRELQEVLERAEGEDRFSVKRIQRSLLRAENKLKKRLDKPRDTGISFEETGIDYLIVDEMHMYKNLATESNIADAAIQGSDRASDLHMKLEHLRSTGRKRIVTGATATPLSNSITEAHVMQRFLRPDLLEEAGVLNFDAWAATFGKTTTEMEMAPTGNSFRAKTRFRQFQNVPEMLRMWSTFADVKTAEDLRLPIPDILQRPDGNRAPETLAVPPTAELEIFVQGLGIRADQVASKKVRPNEDNMLLITGDGRKAALDIRLVLTDEPTGPTKVDIAADSIFQVWQSTRDNTYLDPLTGELSPVPGALQLVFCDLSTPHAERWNVYDQLKFQLVSSGMPAEDIRFIHEAKNDTQKEALFAAARAGHISVLIGSTSKMGVGTNVQNRAVALWHMDAPWRPSDIAQREGRILRQGNQNEQVALVRLVTEKSFDAYMWQLIERKARFIAQIMRGSLDLREIEEIDAASLSAAEAKAISTGNPLLLEHSTVHTELTRLRRLENAHANNERLLLYTRDEAQHAHRVAEENIYILEKVCDRVPDTHGNNFQMTIAHQLYDTRAEASQGLKRWIVESGMHHVRYGSRHFGALGSIGEFTIEIASRHSLGKTDIEVSVRGVPGSTTVMSREAFFAADVGIIQRIENRISGIPSYLEAARASKDTALRTVEDAQRRIGAPFKYADALRQAEEDFARVETELAQLEQSTPDLQTQADQLTSPALSVRPALTVEALRRYQPDPQRLTIADTALPLSSHELSPNERQLTPNTTHLAAEPEDLRGTSNAFHR